MARKQSPARSDDEWFELITECRKSGLSDTAWCQAKSIPSGTFFCAATRLRKKAYALPKRNTSTNTTLDLAPKQDVVRIDIEEPIPQSTTPYLDNSHTIEIDVHGIEIRICNGADPLLLKTILSTLGGGVC